MILQRNVHMRKGSLPEPLDSLVIPIDKVANAEAQTLQHQAPSLTHWQLFKISFVDKQESSCNVNKCCVSQPTLNKME